MAAAPPKDNYLGFPCSGVLNEWLTPPDVGGTGLTDCENLIYHRNGGWGRRPGAQSVNLAAGGKNTPVSGFRWYRAFPSSLTKLFVYANNHLYVGNDERSLNDLGSFDLSGTSAPDFCSMRDPQAGSNGADVCIITGLTLPKGSFGTGSVVISGLPGPQPSGVYIEVNVTNGANSITLPQYFVTGADDPDSIADAITQLLNNSAAFLNPGDNSQFLNESYFLSKTLPYGALDSSGKIQGTAAPPIAHVHMGALDGGNAGNSISYSITLSATTGSLAVNAFGQAPMTSGTSSANFTGGGQQWNGPVRFDWDAGTIVALSYMCPNQFAYCASWHNHLWLWGDDQNPDTVFASDINQPESFTFMIENGGMTGTDNGGYTIGAGDGDPRVKQCLPCGNALYVFKTSNTYMIEGYDFQPGEYQFSVTPQLVGYGVPNRYSAAVLEGQVVFWSGRKFLRLAVGAYEPEHLGLPIPVTEGLAGAGDQTVVRVVAGDMICKTLLNNSFQPGGITPINLLLRSVALFAVDSGDGRADLVCVYDDEKSHAIGQPAWTKWFGWNIGYWVQYGLGKSPLTADSDKPKINFITPGGESFCYAGGDAKNDFGKEPIVWMAQTGWVDFGTPEVIKNAKRIFANMEATSGAQLTVTMIPGQIIPVQPQPSVYSSTPQTAAFGATVAPSNSEADNNLEAYTNDGQTKGALPIQAKSCMFKFEENGVAEAGFELRRWGMDLLEESLST